MSNLQSQQQQSSSQDRQNIPQISNIQSQHSHSNVHNSGMNHLSSLLPGQRSQLTQGRHLSQQQNSRFNPTNQNSHHHSLFQSNNESQSVSSDQTSMFHIYGTNILAQEVKNNIERFIKEFRLSSIIQEVNEDNKSQQSMDIEGQNNQQQNEAFYMEILRQIQLLNYVLIIDCSHLNQFNRNLYKQLIKFPAEMLMLFDDVLSTIYQDIQQDQRGQQILAGFVNLQKEEQRTLRNINPTDINKLVQIKGIVIRNSDIYPEMRKGIFKCTVCGQKEDAIIEKGKILEPNDCANCKIKHSYQIIHNQCTFTNKQYIKIQELPESVPEGETPNSSTMIAYDNNVDSVKPGDRIECVGVFRASGIRQSRNKRTLKSVYNTYVDVISCNKLNNNKSINMENNKMNDQDSAQIQFTEEDKEEFQQISKDPHYYERLVKSLAPSIWENEDVKKGILCQLFGGSQKDFSQSGKGRFRAEINVLLLGDPSVAKSQMLQYVHKIAPRGIYTSGKGSSAVGLTAYVTRDPETKEIVLESGALVLSDQGICCIDEFDKMDDNTRTILHEAMEQQTISVAKAGIVATLNTRTAILAAANPVNSKYDEKKTVIENINLQPTILSRFDLIYLMLDSAVEQKDRRLCQHILNLYTDKNLQVQNQNSIEEENQFSKQTSEKQIDWKSIKQLDKSTLSRYITYARQQYKPKLTEEACDLLKQEYVKSRKLGMSKNVITCTTRQLESAIRLSESLAKMRLSNEVDVDDVNEAYRLIKVATQSAATDPTTGLIDMDMIATGRTAVSKEKLRLLITFVQEIVQSNKSLFSENSAYPFNKLLDQVRDKYHDKYESINEADLAEACRVLSEEDEIVLFGHWKKPTGIKIGSKQH